MFQNYLAGVPNPWQLVGPPVWFQAQLSALDNQIVIFPSAIEAVYRVARRTDDEGMRPIVDSFHSNPDTKVYVKHRLLPITSLLPFTRWGPVVLDDLVSLSIARAGGGKAAADILDARDEKTERAKRQETYDAADSLAHMSWWGAQFKTGGATDLGSGSARQSPALRPQPVYRPLNFAGGSSAFLSAPARTAGSMPAGRPFIASDIHVGPLGARAPRLITP